MAPAVLIGFITGNLEDVCKGPQSLFRRIRQGVGSIFHLGRLERLRMDALSSVVVVT
jgi:hypothetical protein